MSDYLPDVSTLFYIAMAIGILAASLLVGIILGAMIRKGGSDQP